MRAQGYKNRPSLFPGLTLCKATPNVAFDFFLSSCSIFCSFLGACFLLLLDLLSSKWFIRSSVFEMMRCWCGYLSGARCRLFAYGPADGPASQTSPSLASFKSRLVLPFCYQFTQVVLEKRPLNGCISSISVFEMICYWVDSMLKYELSELVFLRRFLESLQCFSTVDWATGNLQDTPQILKAPLLAEFWVTRVLPLFIYICLGCSIRYMCSVLLLHLWCDAVL